MNTEWASAVYTASWYAALAAGPEAQAVRISVGCPKEAKDAPFIGALAPFGLFGKDLPPDEFAAGYRQRLDGYGVQGIRERIVRVARAHPHRPLLLSCYERDPADCHRGLLAEWYREPHRSSDFRVAAARPGAHAAEPARQQGERMKVIYGCLSDKAEDERRRARSPRCASGSTRSTRTARARRRVHRRRRPAAPRRTAALGLRAAIAAAISAADEHGSAELWANTSARFARGTGKKDEARSMLELFTHLRRAGVALRSVHDDEFVTNEMLVGFASAQASKYAEDLSESVKRAKRRQAERGEHLGGPLPLGYVKRANPPARRPGHRADRRAHLRAGRAGRPRRPARPHREREGHRTRSRPAVRPPRDPGDRAEPVLRRADRLRRRGVRGQRRLPRAGRPRRLAPDPRPPAPSATSAPAATRQGRTRPPPPALAAGRVRPPAVARCTPPRRSYRRKATAAERASTSAAATATRTAPATPSRSTPRPSTPP